MDYIINYLIIGYFISLGFYLLMYFSPIGEKFTTRDALGTIIFWPLISYQFIKEIIKNHNDRR